MFQNLKIGAKIALMVLRRHALAIMVGLAGLGYVAVMSLNQVVSAQMLTGTYLRWTIRQTFIGVLPTRAYEYVVLHDGRTVMALAPANWIPPGVGTDVTVEQSILLFGGSRYRIK